MPRRPYREFFQSTPVLFGKTVWYFLTCDFCPNGWCQVESNPRRRKKRCWEHVSKVHPAMLVDLFPESEAIAKEAREQAEWG